MNVVQILFPTLILAVIFVSQDSSEQVKKV